ncbi:hypothetical protein [Streptomyces sp. NPDC006274]|uniref:hypothetical protein n=1 Tax=unclassified Streptomyces TaxID=2593676 RepID=UPI0033BB4ABA
MPDAGDDVAVSLTVDPFDATTAATLTVRAPDGTTSTPATSTSDGGKTWTATVTYSTAGIWRLTWTVTGTGAGVTHELVSVAPAPGGTGTGRVYATSTQLANYLHAAPPTDADRLLARASELLEEEVFRLCWYEADDVTGLPTNAIVAAAFTAAVCAQIEWWDETGDELGAAGQWGTVKLGSASMTRAAGSSPGGAGGGRTVVTDALRKLQSPELTPDIFLLGLVTT